MLVHICTRIGRGKLLAFVQFYSVCHTKSSVYTYTYKAKLAQTIHPPPHHHPTRVSPKLGVYEFQLFIRQARRVGWGRGACMHMFLGTVYRRVMRLDFGGVEFKTKTRAI